MSNNRATITYHGNANRGSRIIPLQSYTNPPAESKFAGLDYVEFRLNNVRCVRHRSVAVIIDDCFSMLCRRRTRPTIARSIEYRSD